MTFCPTTMLKKPSCNNNQQLKKPKKQPKPKTQPKTQSKNQVVHAKTPTTTKKDNFD
jgi:hypothetical protein